MRSPHALLPLLLLVAAGCQTPGAGESMTRTEVYFGLSRPDKSIVPEADFRRFVDQEIAPRFPNGFSILTAEGHWLEGDGDRVTEASRVLVVFSHQADRPAIDAICRTYVARFGQEAVLKAESPARVEFIGPATRPDR